MRAIGVAGSDLDRLSSTDRGDMLCFTCEGGIQAARTWNHLRKTVHLSRHWPVILGPPEEIEPRRKSIEANETTVSDTLRYAETVDFEQWLSKRTAEQLEDFRDGDDGDESTLFAQVGDWPDGVASSKQLQNLFNVSTRKPHERIAIAMVPTQSPWEVPAFLRLGGWNECPEAGIHCAAHRYWHERYRAVIAAATNDVIELSVAKPPTSRDAALELARQQYTYCADIVEQGTQTLANLAASLLSGSTWFFWWD
jgi:hypothetical protein